MTELGGRYPLRNKFRGKLGIFCEACGAEWYVPASEQAAAFSGREEKETMAGWIPGITVDGCRDMKTDVGI